MVKGLFVLIVAAVVFYVYSLVDCLFADRWKFRVFGKLFWVLVIVVLPIVGGLLWFALGRRYGSSLPRGDRPLGPDDDPAFMDGPAGRMK
jgi:hypothetical protein